MNRLRPLRSSRPPTPENRPPRRDPADGSPGGGQPPARPKIPFWGWGIALLAVLALNFWTYGRNMGSRSDRITLTYNEFGSQVTAGNVSKVTITGQDLTGTLKSSITQAQAQSAASSQAGQGSPAPSSGNQQSNKQSETKYSDFQTTLPPFTDPTLLPALKDKNVSVVVHEAGDSVLTSILINAFPLILFGGLLFLMFRQGRGAQQQLFGFGRSKARVHTGEQPTVSFDDVAGEDDAKLELMEVVDFLREPMKYTRMGAMLPRGVLLIGPPGTGKTLLARAVAGEANVPFFSISGSEFVEMFVGVGASRVRDLFEQAKKSAPCIVFVDEIDAVGRQRGAGLGGGNDEREQTLNQILVEMDGFDTDTNVIVMAATNRPDVLDPALLRPGRFDRQVTVGLPDRNGRRAILAVHTRGKPLAPDVDLGTLSRATPGFTGADLANLANEAALHAARSENERIFMADFESALDKIVLGTKQAIVMDEQERRTVAYHESGHTLVASFTPGAEAVHKVTIVPHGRALGVTQQLPIDDRHNYSRDYLLGRLAVMLGGRAAEEVAIGEITTGAENDLKGASELARRMIGIWGMSDVLGPVYFGLGEEHPFLGRLMTQDRSYGDETASEIDRGVQQLVEGAHQQAVSLLAAHREQLDSMAAALLQQETLTGVEVLAIVQQAPTAAPVSAIAAARDGQSPA